MTKQKTKFKILPRKPSKLIRLALGDLKEREADPRYRIDMRAWHNPTSYGECSVCFAGATFARLGAKPKDYLESYDFGGANARRFYALDNFRKGLLGDGLESLGIKRPAYFPSQVFVLDYDLNTPEIFHKAMEKLAARFERAGL